LYSPKSQFCLRGLYNLYRHDIPEHHIGSGTTPKHTAVTKSYFSMLAFASYYKTQKRPIRPNKQCTRWRDDGPDMQARLKHKHKKAGRVFQKYIFFLFHMKCSHLAYLSNIIDIIFSLSLYIYKYIQFFFFFSTYTCTKLGKNNSGKKKKTPDFNGSHTPLCFVGQASPSGEVVLGSSV